MVTTQSGGQALSVIEWNGYTVFLFVYFFRILPHAFRKHLLSYHHGLTPKHNSLGSWWQRQVFLSMQYNSLHYFVTPRSLAIVCGFHCPVTAC
jgi:hypothetical protein